MRLRTRFFLVLNGLGLIILTIFALSLYVLSSRQIRRDQAIAQDETLEKAASVCREAFLGADDISAINYFKLLKKDPAIVQAGCLDASGLLRAHTTSGMIGKTLPAAESGRAAALTRPFDVRGRFAGRALVEYNKDLISARVRRRLLELIYGIAAISAVVMLTVVLGGAILLARTLSAPISELEAVAVEFGKGNFERKPSTTGRADEVGGLARSLTRMARNLGELDRLKQRFLENITHDLRAPLTAISGYAEMIADGMSGPVTEKQSQQLKIVADNSRCLENLIDDILDLAKLEAGGMKADRNPVDLKLTLRSVEELLAASALEYDVQLKTHCEPGLPPVLADAELLRRAVTNLVANALKFTPKSGRITVQAGRDGPGSVRVSVSDTGPGIPPEDLEKVFGKFFQVTETKGQARKAGTGLGLSIAREIVQSHGGRIWAENAKEGGAVFSFTLPVA